MSRAPIGRGRFVVPLSLHASSAARCSLKSHCALQLPVTSESPVDTPQSRKAKRTERAVQEVKQRDSRWQRRQSVCSTVYMYDIHSRFSGLDRRHFSTHKPVIDHHQRTSKRTRFFTPSSFDYIPISKTTSSALSSSTRVSEIYNMESTSSNKNLAQLDSSLEEYNMMQDYLTSIHDVMVTLALEAGAIMLNAKQEFLTSSGTKNNTADIVTKYDIEIEKMIQSRLKAAYPDFSFLGEETYLHGTTLSDLPTFIVDPIDGTLNFSTGFPNCAVSIALVAHKKPMVGVVYNPFRDDLFRAIKGRGAYLAHPNTPDTPEILLPVREHPAPLPNLQQSLIAVEWGNQRSGPNWDLRSSVHKTLLSAPSPSCPDGAFVKSIRSSGSAALDFCYVAQGAVDAFWEGGVWAWDVAAGWCILEEAGGIVASANPGDWDPTVEGRCYFAVRKAEAEEQKALVEAVWKIMGERKFVY
jgi:myo-inositol-1(or 4)-monophosphatase